MRTAEEILNTYVKRTYGYLKKDIISAINEARIETIKECAEVAETKYGFSYGPDEYKVVDEQSILKLIDQIK